MVAFAHEFKSVRTPSGEKPQYPGFRDKVICTDHLGSVREMTDATGAVRARYDYDPFGRITKVSGDLESDFCFTGFYRHQASGLDLTLYREYDAELGRWLSREPLGELGPDGSNLYDYCRNSPMMYRDPSGRFTLVEVVGTAVVAGIALALLFVYNQMHPLAPSPGFRDDRGRPKPQPSPAKPDRPPAPDPKPNQPPTPAPVPWSPPAPVPDGIGRRKMCEEKLVNCLENKYKNCNPNFGNVKPCRDCYDECMNEGIWPSNRCPD